jgi:hypothetical protein
LKQKRKFIKTQDFINRNNQEKKKRKQKITKQDKTEMFGENLVMSATIPTTLVAFFFCLLCIISLKAKVCSNKNEKYELVLQYFILKMIHSAVVFTSSVVYEWDKNFNANSDLNCSLEHSLSAFCESCSNFVLLFIWLYLMWERKLVGSKKEQSENETHQEQNSEMNFFNKIMIFLSKNPRHIILACYYALNFGLSIQFSRNYIFSAYDCSRRHVLVQKLFSIHTLPIAFMTFIFTTFFWRFFGGSQDPILTRTEHTAEKRLIKFIKFVTLIDIFELILSIFSGPFFSHYTIQEANTYGTFIRLIEAACTLTTAILFFYFENKLNMESLKALALLRKHTNSEQNNDTLIITQNEII